MSITELMISTVAFLQRHKQLLVLMTLAAAGPSLVLAAPDLLARFEELSPRIRFSLMAIAGVLAVALAIALTRALCRALVRAWRRRLEHAEQRRRTALWNAAFKRGSLSGAETVGIVWKAAGSVTNIMRTPGHLSAPLISELSVARRGVMILPDSSPGVGIDSPPRLAGDEADEQVAEFLRHPVRDDARAAGRQAQLWTTQQLPYLTSFLSSVEIRVGIHIVGRGCSSLTDSIMGFGPEIRGTEGNLFFYIHDPQDAAEEKVEAELNDPEDINLVDMWKMHSPVRV